MFKGRYLANVSYLAFVLLACQGALAAEYATGKWFFKNSHDSADGENINGKLCASLMASLEKNISLKKLNESRDRERLDGCAYSVVVNYNGFDMPKWVELNVSENKLLILKIFLFRNSLSAYFKKFDANLTPMTKADSDFFDVNKDIADRFIAGGGKIYVLKNPALDVFSRFSNEDVPKNQVLVRLGSPSETNGVDSSLCPALENNNNVSGMMVFVTEDLTEIDKRTSAVSADFWGAELRMYKGEPLLIYHGFKSVYIANAETGYVSSFCKLSYGFNKK